MLKLKACFGSWKKQELLPALDLVIVGPSPDGTRDGLETGLAPETLNYLSCQLVGTFLSFVWDTAIRAVGPLELEGQ